MPPQQRVAVVLASAGRPHLLADVINDLRSQTVPYKLVLSVPDDASLPADVPSDATVVHARGLAAQRNAGIAVVPEAEFVFCFDDDAVVRSDYLGAGMAYFDAHPEVVGLTGRVLLDGATGEEVPRHAAMAAIAASDSPGSSRFTTELYGCNFAFRMAGSGSERFDARLPLYSWLEDLDFATRLLRHGRLASIDDCVIVHRGAKSGGRVAHRRLGYSQMMNPLYLRRAGSFSWGLALRQIVFRCGKNLVNAIAGPERAWRRERLAGNLIAARDALRGRYTPERMLEL